MPYYTVNNIEFASMGEVGSLGNIFFPNGYGASLLRINTTPYTYDLALLKKVDEYAWSAEHDSEMDLIFEDNTVQDISEELANYYLELLQTISV